MRKFEIGDRVILVRSTTHHNIGDKSVVTKVWTNPDNFTDDDYVYGLECIPNGKYVYDSYLIIDVEYYRNEKLDILGI